MFDITTSWAQALSLHTATTLLWLLSKGAWRVNANQDAMQKPLGICALLVAMVTLAAWIDLLGVLPGLFGAVWTSSLLGTATVFTLKFRHHWMILWVLLTCILGGFHGLTT